MIITNFIIFEINNYIKYFLIFIKCSISIRWSKLVKYNKIFKYDCDSGIIIFIL